MSYQVIARKWRPQSFDDVVGQNHITQTLFNSIKNDRVHHALLLTGPRGTGKTSTARIVAKVLRCPNVENFKPCNQCDSCKEISASRSLDVQELDAASNNSVEDIRRLLDGVMNAPASGVWKIYIIDEVHMLSTSAFNALLKTLEEPPKHVLFILATTDVHKIPDTILSRVQRFDFKRIATRQIAERLEYICSQEKVPASQAALWAIARQGDGSLRDSLSLLDQVIAFSRGEIDEDQVIQILGLTEKRLIAEALEVFSIRDVGQAAKLLEKLNQAGVEPKIFMGEILTGIRNLLIIKASGAQATELLDVPDADLKILAEMAKKWSEEDLHLMFDMALKGFQDLSRTADPMLVLEVLMLRLASAPRIKSIEELLRHAASNVDTNAFKSNEAVQAKAQEAEPQVMGRTPEEKWVHFVDLVRAQDAFFAAKIENLLFQGEKGQMIQIAVPPKMLFLKEQMSNPEIRKKLKGYIDSLWGRGYSFEINGSLASSAAPAAKPAGESAQTMVTKKKEAQEADLRKTLSELPQVKAAQAVFGGQIKSIVPSKEGGSSK